MDTLGLSLVVGGFALLVSGLIFLLPTGRRRMAQDGAITESIEKIDEYLHQIRRERGDLS
jgi:hypothetical protein